MGPSKDEKDKPSGLDKYFQKPNFQNRISVHENYTNSFFGCQQSINNCKFDLLYLYTGPNLGGEAYPKALNI